MAGRDIGEFIRELRNNAKVSLRQLADQAGVSNPYLSQIERGLRKPSAEVLQQIANALKVSTPVMYLRAGLLNDKDGPGTLSAIASDPDLTTRQKQTLTEVYDAFRRENARARGEDLDDSGEPNTAMYDTDVAEAADAVAEGDEADDDEAPVRPVRTTKARDRSRGTRRPTGPDSTGSDAGTEPGAAEPSTKEN